MIERGSERKRGAADAQEGVGSDDCQEHKSIRGHQVVG